MSAHWLLLTVIGCELHSPNEWSGGHLDQKQSNGRKWMTSLSSLVFSSNYSHFSVNLVKTLSSFVCIICLLAKHRQNWDNNRSAQNVMKAFCEAFSDNTFFNEINKTFLIVESNHVFAEKFISTSVSNIAKIFDIFKQRFDCNKSFYWKFDQKNRKY